MADTPTLPSMIPNDSDVEGNTLKDALNVLKEEYDSILPQLIVETRTLSEPAGGESKGERFVVKVPGTGDWVGLDNSIVEAKVNNPASASDWKYYPASDGLTCYVKDEDAYLYWDVVGSAWIALPAAFIHNNLSGLQGDGGDELNEYYHLTSEQKEDLTDGSDTELHTHDGRYYEKGDMDIILADKADKVEGATAGNLAGVNEEGNLTDSGAKADDFEEAGAVGTHESTYDHTKLHTQNTDTILDEDGEHEVSAEELRDHVDDSTIHRSINDAGTGETDLWSADKIDEELGGKSDTDHTHDDRYYTEDEIDDLIDDYYTADEVDDLLDDKSDTDHTHDDRYYTETETDEKISQAIQGLDWQDSVLDRFDPTPNLPVGPTVGDRYISTATARGWTIDRIYERATSSWIETIPNEGYTCEVEDENIWVTFNGTSWVNQASIMEHNVLAGKDGGTTDEYYHLTHDEHDDLTDSGATTLHKHDHGGMDGLGDDDHSQYHNNTRGDTRYPLKYSGTGSPEGAQVATYMSIYEDTGTAKVYIKTTDTGNTGWLEITTGGQGMKQMSFWSNPADTVDVALTTLAGNKTLPSVTIENNAFSGTISKVVPVMKFRSAKDSSAVANKLDGAQAIQVKESVGGSFIDALNMADDTIKCAASSETAGDVVLGKNDVKAQIANPSGGAKTYTFQWTSGKADGSSLTLYDVQCGLIVYFT